MLAFVVQTLFALQSTDKPTGSCASHLSRTHLPSSPPFIVIRGQGRTPLFASPRLQFGASDRGETLDWLQERLVLNNEQLIKLVKRHPKIDKLSVEEQLKPTLDWLQVRIGLSDEELAKSVRKQPTALDLSVQEQLEPNTSWLQDRLSLDQESLQTAVVRN
jgi:hypothetical protein